MSQDGRRSARSLIRPHLNDLPPYGTMESAAAVASELGLDVAEISKLDGNENPYGASPRVAAALAGYSDYHLYPDAGQTAVREAVGRYVGVEPEQIVLGSGADEMLGMAATLFLDPGDALVNAPPTFGRRWTKAPSSSTSPRPITPQATLFNATKSSDCSATTR